MLSLLVRILYIASVTWIVKAQIWDLFGWPEESEDEDDFWLDYEYENITEPIIVAYSSEALKEEKILLETSSDIIMEELSTALGTDADDVLDDVALDINSDEIGEEGEPKGNIINDLVAEHILEVFSILNILKASDEDRHQKRKLKFNDIFLWSNVSDERINEIIDGYYQES